VCVTHTVKLCSVGTRLNISSSTLANFVSSRDSLLPSNIFLYYSCCQLHRSGSSSQQHPFVTLFIHILWIMLRIPQFACDLSSIWALKERERSQKANLRMSLLAECQMLWSLYQRQPHSHILERDRYDDIHPEGSRHRILHLRGIGRIGWSGNLNWSVN
jgi:hypothetical protein